MADSKILQSLPVKTIIIILHLFCLSIAISSLLSRNWFNIYFEEYDIKATLGMFEICLNEKCIPYHQMIRILIPKIEFIKIWIGISIFVVLCVFITLMINILNVLLQLFELNLWIFDILSCKI